MAHEKKKFEWTAKMTAVTVACNLFLMIVLVLGTLGNWLKVPITYSQRMSVLEDAKNISTQQITSFVKENTLAHQEIKNDLNSMNAKLENLCGKMEILVSDRPKQTVWTANSEPK
jgi:hypothetical protein